MTALTDLQDAASLNDVKRATLQQTAIQTLIDAGVTGQTATITEINTVADGIHATATEINEMADMSTKVESPATGDLVLTAAAYGNRYLYYDDADGTITLPAATGTGYKYTIILKTAFTSGTIQAASAADSFLGGINGVDDDADAAYAWKAETDDDTITGSGTTTGGKKGDLYEFVDIATGLFFVSGFITQSGGSEVTPFSAAVT